MHHHLELILTLTSCLTVALVLGYISHRLRLSPIVGYLLAGMVVGPQTPGFVADQELADQLAEVGIILLMFGVGLHFHFDELMGVRRIAVPGAIGQSLIATLLGCLVGWWFGWSLMSGLVFGLAVSVASTVVLLRVLSDQNELHTPSGHIAVGWLVVEDIFTVIVLVLLPVLASPDRVGIGPVVLALSWAALKFLVMIGFIAVAGKNLIPWVMGQVAATRSRELFTLTILVLALGIAVGSAKLFGVSMALGAFLAGMVVGRSDFSSRAAAEALPMRDAFAVLFFVSVGMMFQPAELLAAPWLSLATLGIVLIGKPLAALAIVVGLGYPLRIALAVALALSQIGEFSFILAAQGKELHILPDAAGNALVVSALVSISLNPLLYRLIDPLESWLRRSPRIRAWLHAQTRRRMERAAVIAQPEPLGDRTAIVVGYGPVGRTLARLLRANDIEPTIIDLNLETVHRLRREGWKAVYGDASHQETLREAGLDRAVAVFLSSAGMSVCEAAIRLIKTMSPRTQVVVRSNYLKEIADLERAGADAVVSSEGEVALTMTERLLRQLGASPEQIERERERVQTDLFGEMVPVGPLPTTSTIIASNPSARDAKLG